MLAAFRSKSVAETEEVLLIDLIEYPYHRLFNVSYLPARQCRSAVDDRPVSVSKPVSRASPGYLPLCTRPWRSAIRLSRRSPYSCHVISSTPACRVALERRVGISEHFIRDMMHQIGEPKFLVPYRCLTYPVKSVQCFLLSPRTGRRRLFRISPWSSAFPPEPPPWHGSTPFCSAPSSVVRRCQTAQQRACKDYGHWPSLAVLPPCDLTAGTAELSRFSNIECKHMHRVSDSAGPDYDWLFIAVIHVAFPFLGRGRHPEGVISELIGWPMLPLSTLHVQPRDRPRMTRGRDGSAHPFT